MTLRKYYICLFLSLEFFAFAQGARSAQEIKKAALQQDSVEQTIKYIKSSIDSCAGKSDRRSLLYFLGTLQEQSGLYENARASYAEAASIAAGDAAGMVPVSAETLVLCAVRVSLYTGDCDSADSYLQSAVKNSSDPNILARVKLYGVWSQLCRAGSIEETQPAINLLKSYSLDGGMKSVRPAVLFTLWYLTQESSYAQTLKKEFPHSPETALVNGNASLAGVPFWHFVPRSGMTAFVQVDEHYLSGTASSQKQTAKSESAAKPEKSSAQSKAEVQKKVREQLGLFKSRSYAEELLGKVNGAGFKGYIEAETRSSGTTYFIVYVDEAADGNSIGKRLKQAGFDCYPVEVK